MARHNRTGKGRDQFGLTYHLSYQPDWFDLAKVTRRLPNGRQSTKTLFRNPDPPQATPGDSIRTRIECPESGLDVEVVVTERRRAARSVRIECVPPEGGGPGDVVELTIYGRPDAPS